MCFPSTTKRLLRPLHRNTGVKGKLRDIISLKKNIQIPLKIPKAGRTARSKFTLDLVNKVLDDTGVDLEKTQANYFLDIVNSAFLPYN